MNDIIKNMYLRNKSGSESYVKRCDFLPPNACLIHIYEFRHHSVSYDYIYACDNDFYRIRYWIDTPPTICLIAITT